MLHSLRGSMKRFLGVMVGAWMGGMMLSTSGEARIAPQDFKIPKPSRPSLQDIRLPCPLKRGCVVSSPFSKDGRPHPVLKGVVRPHLATDFACRTGDAVVSVGEGIIVYVNRGGDCGVMTDIFYPAYDGPPVANGQELAVGNPPL